MFAGGFVVPPARHVQGVPTTCELAVFRGDDAPALVDASLSCTVCLSGAVEWSLLADVWEAEVECRCHSCGHGRTVSVTGEQALRLALHPHAV